MKLDDEQYLRLIETAPLISIDLIVRNESNKILLGIRNNRPAQGFWFVPGGRIRKNERIDVAIERIAKAELGAVPHCEGLLGVFEHFYEDNFFGAESIDTHCIALAYDCRVSQDFMALPDSQNEKMAWWSLNHLLADKSVHPLTKMYFRHSA
jgi:colanic acid biosynthesis protein WcaH